MSKIVSAAFALATFTLLANCRLFSRRQDRSQDCCGISGIDKSSHSACKAPSSDFESFVAVDKDMVLQIHKICRENVYPFATDMAPIQWDDTLACVAQQYAAQCPQDHDAYDQRKYPAAFPYVGQNLAVAWGTVTVGELTKAWCDEQSNWQYGVGALSTDSPVGHFTQMVWSKTTHVGCGAALCKTEGRTYFVCNYGPAGNVKSPSNPVPKARPYAS